MWEELSYLRESEPYCYPSKERLAASYKSCEEAGIRREQERIEADWSQTQVQALVSAYLPLLTRARELFANVHRLLVDKTSVLILTDRAARVLDIYSVPPVIDRCGRIGLTVGASLAESHIGTNAVALVLRYREPVMLRGRQHFCHIFSDWYCVAAPIIADDGSIAGCVDLSMNRKARLGDKLPLVTMLAAQIGELLGELNRRDGPERDAGDWTFISPRQRAIVNLLIAGHVAKEIASDLGISQRTVESHLEKLRKRFHAKTTVEMVAKLQKARRRLAPKEGGRDCLLPDDPRHSSPEHC